MPLSLLLKQLRTEAKLSQTALAEKAGVSAGFVRDVEQGRREDITWDNVRKLAAALGVSCEAFKDADPPKPKKKPKS